MIKIGSSATFDVRMSLDEASALKDALSTVSRAVSAHVDEDGIRGILLPDQVEAWEHLQAVLGQLPPRRKGEDS